jgi:hypothetical protein
LAEHEHEHQADSEFNNSNARACRELRNSKKSKKAKVRGSWRKQSPRIGKADFDKTSGFRSPVVEGRSRLKNLLTVPPQFGVSTRATNKWKERP